MNEFVETAHIAQAFVNAIGAPESPRRAELEQRIFSTLTDAPPPSDGAPKKPRRQAIWRSGIVCCFEPGSTPDEKGRELWSTPFPEGTCDPMVWTDGKTVSQLDQQRHDASGRLVFLGAGALALSIPGIVEARMPKGSSDSGGSSSNNNNNNNNNNG